MKLEIFHWHVDAKGPRIGKKVAEVTSDGRRGKLNLFEPGLEPQLKALFESRARRPRSIPGAEVELPVLMLNSALTLAAPVLALVCIDPPTRIPVSAGQTIKIGRRPPNDVVIEHYSLLG